MDIELLQERAAIFRKIRRFFDERAYLETDTPLLAPDLIPESCLEVFETSYLPPPGSRIREAQPYWLIPSPEIWMKRLIAQHRVSMYQIGKCFRNGESTGRLHSPEFTMLEYYTMDADYEDSLGITEALFTFLIEEPHSFGTVPQDISPPFLRVTMDEAFSRWVGFSLFEAVEGGRLEAEARKLGLTPSPGMSQADLYNLIFVHAVEPKLPRDRPVVLMDYPAFVPCLAKQRPDGKTMERWELYVRGIELANCYSEETDSAVVRRYFETETAIKEQTALVPHNTDKDYWKLFLPRTHANGVEHRFPRCSGVAMGLDRLIMVLTGKTTLDGVLTVEGEERDGVALHYPRKGV
jgi:lysyl-tRNA synthetase class 2